MPDLYSILKASRLNPVDAPDGMTAIWAKRLMSKGGGYSELTLTGVPPFEFYSSGDPIISLSMLGNTQQSGTPTPDAPIMPTFCGVRTGNLFDASNTLDNARVGAKGEVVNDNSCVLSDYIPVLPNGSYSQSRWFTYSNALAEFDENKEFIKRYVSGNGNITTSENTRFIRVSCAKTGVDSFMLNAGTEPLPYEPYGWAEKITCAGQTTPVYLSEVPTVRRVKKLVLTGKENWRLNNRIASVGGQYFNISIATQERTEFGRMLCSHYPVANPYDRLTACCVLASYSQGIDVRVNNPSTEGDINDFKFYLAQQYAAGTPVTVWYVLAELTIGIINEPLAKIGDYADELHSTDAGVSIPTAKGQNTLTVDTELQPSSATITYRGRPINST